MEDSEDGGNVYCIFNKEKENINLVMGKAFEIYLKEYSELKENT